LKTDSKPGAIHHREHAGHAGVLFADEKRGRAATIAEEFEIDLPTAAADVRTFLTHLLAAKTIELS